jgi:hypothetical protein
LPPHDEGTLIFCTQCGAPQVLLSEELLTQVEAQNKPDAAGADAVAGPRDPRSLVWAGAIRCAALAGAVTAGLMCLSILLPPVELLALLWAVVSPVIVLGLFQARFPLVPITTGFGARLGLLTGISITVVLGVFNTAKLLVARYGIHAMGEFDKQLSANMDQLRAQAMTQPGTPMLSWINALQVPEFRAGLILMSVAMLTGILLVVTTAGGAFAGFARSRPRA